jgi:transposase
VSCVISQLLGRFSMAYTGGSVTLRGMKAYSLDLPQNILRACDQRLISQRAIGALFGVSQSFVEKLLRRHRRTTEDIMAWPYAGGDKAILALRKVGIRVCRQGGRGAYCDLT